MTVPSLEELGLLHENICQAVGDPKRIQMLYALHEQPRNVNVLAEALDLPQPTVSRHLAILRQRGMVTAERDGNSAIYRLVDSRIIEVLDTMRLLLRDAMERRADMLTGTVP